MTVARCTRNSPEAYVSDSGSRDRGGDLAGRGGDRRGVRLLARQRLLGRGGPDGIRRRPADDEARARADAVLHLDDGRDADDGVGRGGMAVLQVHPAGALAVGRYEDGRDDLAGLQRRREQVQEEVSGRDLALALGPAGDDRGAEGDEDRGEVGRGIRVGDRAADRPAVADLQVADLGGGLGEDGARLADEGETPRSRRASSWRRSRASCRGSGCRRGP